MNSLRDKLPKIGSLQEKLTALREKNNLKSGNSNFYLSMPKKQDEVNTAMIRIMPHPKYNFESFIETWVHYNLGDHGVITCSKLNEYGNLFNEDGSVEQRCAICEHRSALYELANEIAREHETDPKDYEKKMLIEECKQLHELAKQIKPVMRVYVPVFVRTKEHEGIKFWGVNETVYKKLFNECIKIASKYPNKSPLNPYEGVDIEISVSNTGKKYGETSIAVQVGDDPTKCFEGKTDEQIDEIVNAIPDIWKTICKKSTYEDTERIINSLMGPEGIIDISKSETEENDSTTESIGAETEVAPEPVMYKKQITPSPIKPTVTKKPTTTTQVSESTKKTQSKALEDIDLLNEEL